MQIRHTLKLETEHISGMFLFRENLNKEAYPRTQCLLFPFPTSGVATATTDAFGSRLPVNIDAC